ncbi:DUF998 domain-containing protein [Nocardioides sp. JQ2195]|uniref:DUF998 domain-containing protein n=1 Tax=Nocardioides sp. JQ2195 TaxID=2592334 RepID=UPI00143E14B0|nr:DUF998 domain-containing protein [Nocardioides sp. JQ2195]QIX26912.1 DUF998 domain-containing protein [Nocardioides sp. JQ2195]
MSRRLALVGVASFLCFWACDALAVLLAADDYSVRRDMVSALAGRGSSVGWLGETAIAAFVVGHACAAAVMLTGWRTKLAGAVMGQGAFLMAGLLVFRGHCPEGEAGCGRGGNHVVDLGTTLHAVFGSTYLWMMLVGLLVPLASAYWERGPTRWVALSSVVAWLASSTAASVFVDNGPTAGIWERLWLGSIAAWLLLVCLVGLRDARRGFEPRV